MQDGQFPSEVVEGGSPVLQGVGDNQHPTLRDVRHVSYLDAYGLRLRVELLPESYGWALLGGGEDFGLKRCEMFMCPTDFGSASSQRVAHDW